MPDIELTWLLSDEEDQTPNDLLSAYYSCVAGGPMKDYRRIIQGGNKQGQNYYVHVLDGINVLHKLRAAHVIEMSDLEEKLLFAAYTIHDMNKIPPYGGRDVALSYSSIATRKNISIELARIGIGNFLPDWELLYLEDIRLLMLLHQHDTAPLLDLNLNNHVYTLPYKRLLELGKLMYAVDNLDLSHTLSEKKHKENALASINAVAECRWRWVTHHLSDNRAVFSNFIHNATVEHLQRRYAEDDHPGIADLLYYPDGVAYLLPEQVTFTWSDDENATLAQGVANSIKKKKVASLHQLVKGNQLGIRVSQAAIESGANYTDMMYVIRQRVEKKIYSQAWHDGYNQKLRHDIEAATTHADQAVSTLATMLLSQPDSIVPYEQVLLKRGELALAYYNLLNDHLKEALHEVRQHDPWTHIYTQLNLPKEKYLLYEEVDRYRRAYFIACDCDESIDTLFERMLADVADLVGETVEESMDDESLRAYLSENLEFQAPGYVRDFTAHLRYYCKARHKQCCMCSSPSSTVKLMDAEVPAHMGVQAFSNRLRGGSGEPKRNVCSICRTQLILEKLTRVSFNKKKSSEYTNFYVHLYPYSFFTRSYQDAIYFTLKNIVHEDNQCFYFQRDAYYPAWDKQFEQGLHTQIIRQAQRSQEQGEVQFRAGATKVNGISVPLFSEATSNTPALPLNAPGENYTQQFMFALTHALMIADFFGCRVALSRTPFPLLSNDYMFEQKLAFFVDNVPLNLRWILPVNEYRSLETYRDGQAKEGGEDYLQRQANWQSEKPDEQGCAAYENISKRLTILYQLSRQLNLNPEESEQFRVELAMALADDPLSVYHIVDLTIEKQLREKRRTSEANRPGSGKRKRDTKIGTTRHIAPEQQAIYLSKRVAPLLEKIVKE